MPTEMSSWADEIDETDTSLSLPPPSEKWVGNQKITTEYSHNDEGKKVRIIRTFKIEKKLVSKSVAKRKALPKFGMSRNDRPGPDPATTIVSEEILMNFVHNKEECEKDVEDKSAIQRLADSNKGVVKCRICKEDHWTTMCPYKDTLGPLRDSLAGTEKEEGGASEIGKSGDSAKQASGMPGAGGPGGAGPGPGGAGPGGKYVPPSRRGAEGRIGESMPDRKGRDADTAAIRVSNLSENTQEGDLQELFKPFGHIARIYLAKDKITGQCKGFAFINYHKKDDAQKAIATLNGFGYDHLILNVEWAKPSGT